MDQQRNGKGKGKAKSPKPRKNQQKAVNSLTDSESTAKDSSNMSTEPETTKDTTPPTVIPAPQLKRSLCPWPKVSYKHCHMLPGHADGIVAADHVCFRESASLVYHFLHIKEPEVDNGDLVACTLECTWCQGTANGLKWQWSVASQGSTSNFGIHFNKHHPAEWAAAKKADAAATGKEVAKGEADGSTKLDNFFSNVSY
jgi:hypothetical protein